MEYNSATKTDVLEEYAKLWDDAHDILIEKKTR